jgi:hypothetical protein
MIQKGKIKAVAVAGGYLIEAKDSKGEIAHGRAGRPKKDNAE